MTLHIQPIIGQATTEALGSGLDFDCSKGWAQEGPVVPALAAGEPGAGPSAFSAACTIIRRMSRTVNAFPHSLDESTTDGALQRGPL